MHRTIEQTGVIIASMAEDKKITVRLTLAGKVYPLGLDPEKEEMYRRAEQEVNEYFAKMKRQQYKNFIDADYMALTALKFAIDKVEMSRNREVIDADLKALQRIDSELESYLNSLDKRE